MADDRIDSIIDLTATQKEVDALALQVAEVVKLIQSTKSKAVEVTTTKSVAEYGKLNKELGGLIQQTDAAAKASTVLAEAGKKTADGISFQIKSYKEFGSTLTDSIQKQLALKNRLDEVKESLKKLNEFEEAGKNSKEFADEVVRLTTEQAHLQNELTETNRLIKLQVKEMSSEEETLKQARAANLLLLKQRDETNVKTEEGRKKIAELNLEIDKNNELIKENSSTLEKVKINIGNYAGSLAGAFDKVIEEIQKVKNKNEELKSSFQNLSGGRTTIQGFKAGQTGGVDPQTEAQLKSLTTEIDRNEKALAHLNQTTALGFKVGQNHIQQVRQLENAYIGLATSGTVSDEFLNEFKNAIGSVKDDVNDLRQSIKLAASDTRSLDVLIGTAQAIAGGFGIAQGAAALFGDENEDLQRTLVKLNGIMTILNGLQAIQNELKKKDNILTVIQTNLQKGYTAIIGTSTGALKAFRTALAATGIGLFLIAIGALVLAFDRIKAAMSGISDEQQNLIDQAEKNVEIQDQNLELLNSQDNILKQQGKSEEFIVKQKIEQLKKNKLAKLDLLEARRLTLDSQREAQQRSFSIIKTIIDIVTLPVTAISKVLGALTGKKLPTLGDIVGKELFDPKKIDKDFNELQDKIKLETTQIQNEIAGLELGLEDKRKDAAKKSAEERKKELERLAQLEERNRRARFEIEKLDIESRLKFLQKSIDDESELERAKAKNLPKSEIAEIEKRVQKERLDALQSFVIDKINLIRKEAEFELEKAGLTSDEMQLIERQKQDKITDVLTDAIEKRLAIIVKLNEEEKKLYKNAAEKISDAISRGIEEANEKLKEGIEKEKEIADQKKDLYKELYSELTALAFDFLTAQYEREKNLIQDQIDLLERKKQKDIEVANATITNARDRADAISIINDRAQAEEDILEQKKRQVSIKEAQFEKAESIANIIAKTAEAIIASLAKNPPPAGLPLAFLIGAIGAAQLARVIATPIPRYAEGTDNHKGGLAVVGDAGKSEGIKLPDGTVMKTPAVSTLVDLPKGTQVFPDFNHMMLKATLTDVPVFKETTRSDKTEAAVKRMEKSVVTAIKKIPQPITTAENIISRKIRSGSGITNYLTRAI